ncbi:uncharacterized protein [Pyrus communis]|uniref:uncharacterized protein n=1 Tax=Pyrus communis TaxID=23211 RepID=UPI0035BFCAAB
MERLLAYWYAIAKQLHLGINLIKILAEADNGPVLLLDKVQAAPVELKDNRPQVKDPLEEINVGTTDEPRPLFISALLSPPMKVELSNLLNEFKDCFTWNYHEMPGLDQNLVEHELCIKTARYVEWLANIVPVLKKIGALHICIDFRNLNLATPKDEYTIPISDLLIDVVANRAMLSFMDGHADYNRIFIAEADVHKTVFYCPEALSTYEWVVMPFDLKNADATYQRVINMIFYDLIETVIEDSDRFKWREEHQATFTQIKVSFTTPPVLVPPRRGMPLKPYISVANEFIGCLLAQDNDAGREQAIFDLNRNLNSPKINYSPVEKLCLALFFATSKLRHYMLPSVTQKIRQISDILRAQETAVCKVIQTLPYGVKTLALEDLRGRKGQKFLQLDKRLGLGHGLRWFGRGSRRTSRASDTLKNSVKLDLP